MSEAEKMPYSATTLLAARLMVLAPHPDDEIFACGGALALLCDHGASGQIHVFTDGALGGISSDEEPLTEKRQQESQRAQSALQTDEKTNLIFWGFPDRSLSKQADLGKQVRDAINAFHPDLVFAPSLMEVHPDHLALAIEAFTCWSSIPVDRTFDLLMYEIGRPLEANCLVDITSVIHRKRLAMQCFDTQLADRDYLGVVEGLNRYRSYTLGNLVHAAEGYFRLLGSSRSWDPTSATGDSEALKLLPASMRGVLEDTHELKH